MHCRVVLRAVNDQTIKVHGLSTMKVTFGQVTFEQEFIIVDGINEHCIVGMDAIRKQGFVIDGALDKVYIKDKDERIGNLVTSRAVNVPPRSSRIIPCRLKVENPDIQSSLLFEPNVQLPDNVHLESTLFSADRGTQVLCINESDQPVRFSRKTQLGPVVCGVSDVCLDYGKEPSSKNPKILNDFSFEGIEEEHVKELKKLIFEFSDIFANSNNDLGKLKTVKHEIRIQEHPPIKQRPYRIPYSLKNTMSKQIKEMLESGVIVPSKSPWTSPVVLVKKKTER